MAASHRVRQPGRAASLRGTSSALTETLADLAFTVGQGPAWDALAGRRPVLVGDVGADQRWSQTGPALAEAGVRSVAALPLQVGAATLGALTLFHDRQMTFDRPDVADLLELAAASTNVLFDRLAGGRSPLSGRSLQLPSPPRWCTRRPEWSSSSSTATWQKPWSGRRGHAYRDGLPLADIAAAGVAGTVQLTP